MKVAILALFVAVALVGQTNAWWGGYGLGWGGWGYGLGLGYGLGYGGWGWPAYRWYRSSISTGDFSRRAQCVYIRDRSVLSCRAQQAPIECDAEFRLPESSERFELFGLGFMPGQEQWSAEEMCYSMYPRSLDNSRWFNYTSFEGERESYRYSLYYRNSSSLSYGLRVRDFACWERLVSYFRSCPADEIIRFENNSTVGLYGEVSLVERVASREAAELTTVIEKVVRDVVAKTSPLTVQSSEATSSSALPASILSQLDERVKRADVLLGQRVEQGVASIENRLEKVARAVVSRVDAAVKVARDTVEATIVKAEPVAPVLPSSRMAEATNAKVADRVVQ